MAFVVRCPSCQKKVQFGGHIVVETNRRCPLCGETMTLRPVAGKAPEPATFGEAPRKVTFEETNEPPGWMPGGPPPIPKHSIVPSSPATIPPKYDVETDLSTFFKYTALIWTILMFGCAVILVWFSVGQWDAKEVLSNPHGAAVTFFGLLIFWGILAIIWIIPTIGLALLSISFRKK